MIPLEQHRIPSLPPTAYYIPSFLTPPEITHITTSIYSLPLNRWTTLSHRRLLSLPSHLTSTSQDTLLASPLPYFLSEPIISRFQELGIFASSPHQTPNHVLVNEYQPGQGIMPHEDGPAYFTITATVSLGSYTVLDIYGKNDRGEREKDPSWRILQEEGSLLVTMGPMYEEMLHGIAEVEKDEGLNGVGIVNWDLLGDREPFRDGKAERRKRISLTYRDVLKVAKVGGALKFMNKR